jgi:hypothetical protein
MNVQHWRNIPFLTNNPLEEEVFRLQISTDLHINLWNWKELPEPRILTKFISRINRCFFIWPNIWIGKSREPNHTTFPTDFAGMVLFLSICSCIFIIWRGKFILFLVSPSSEESRLTSNCKHSLDFQIGYRLEYN